MPSASFLDRVLSRRIVEIMMEVNSGWLLLSHISYPLELDYTSERERFELPASVDGGKLVL